MRWNGMEQRVCFLQSDNIILTIMQLCRLISRSNISKSIEAMDFYKQKIHESKWIELRIEINLTNNQILKLMSLKSINPKHPIICKIQRSHHAIRAIFNLVIGVMVPTAGLTTGEVSNKWSPFKKPNPNLLQITSCFSALLSIYAPQLCMFVFNSVISFTDILKNPNKVQPKSLKRILILYINLTSPFLLLFDHNQTRANWSSDSVTALSGSSSDKIFAKDSYRGLWGPIIDHLSMKSMDHSQFLIRKTPALIPNQLLLS